MVSGMGALCVCVYSVFCTCTLRVCSIKSPSICFGIFGMLYNIVGRIRRVEPTAIHESSVWPKADSRYRPRLGRWTNFGIDTSLYFIAFLPSTMNAVESILVNPSNGDGL